MYLDEVSKTLDYPVNDSAESTLKKPVFEKWRNFPISKISHHGKPCCEIALEWLSAMDFSHLNGESVLTGPRWIRQRYNWGPTNWKIHWCEAVKRKNLDCGAQAALAQKVFKSRGVKSYQVQMVQQYSKEATDQWQKRWNRAETSTHWINKDLIYHEGCAVVIDEGEIKIWDSSAAWWVHSQQFGGYGSIRAVRLFAPKEFSGSLNWGDYRIHPNKWQEI